MCRKQNQKPLGKDKKLIILSGAGISAESGLATFRASGGLWEDHRIEDVATPEAWRKNPERVLEFYNQRRKQAFHAEPNRAHHIIRELEDFFEVVVVTQNVDNLHERAGSSNVIHLHGQLFQSRSSKNEALVQDIEGWELKMGDLGPDGAQLRPHIVWFGEAVPMMSKAIEEAQTAEYMVIVGTSLQVYPAASLIDFVPLQAQVFVVDPDNIRVSRRKSIQYFQEQATTGLEKLKTLLTGS
jgi:NAD-dependent deacetylase